jgi:hypothetical protein
MTQENPGTDPITNSLGSSPQNDQSILKDANVGGDLTTGDISQTVNNQSSGAGGVNVGRDVIGSTIINVNVVTNDLSQAPLFPQNNDPQANNDNRACFFAYDSDWVGRRELVATLSTKLRESHRVLLILGLTGIGKTALAEKISLELRGWLGKNWESRFLRANLENEANTIEFATVARRWLEEMGQKVQSEDNKPENLLNILINYLRKNQLLILIDSLERILIGSEKEGWNSFVDIWWQKFFEYLLGAESCKSRALITSQDLQESLTNYRYHAILYKQVLYGLTEIEQLELFQKTGLESKVDFRDRHILPRIGKAYQGHPLILRVIIGEIIESFSGNLHCYWNHVGEKIIEVETALSEAEKDAAKVAGSDDAWELHKLTRRVQLEANKNRLEYVFRRLKEQAIDAYILLCTASIYRKPVQEKGWLLQFHNLIRRIEKLPPTQKREEQALEILCNRYLVEISINHNNKRLLGQHNLIRSVALELHKELMNENSM